MDLFITGQKFSLATALEHRIMDRMMHTLVEFGDSADLTISFNGPGDPNPSTRPLLLIRRFDSNPTPLTETGVCEIRIRDFLTPLTSDPLGENIVDSMLSGLDEMKYEPLRSISHYWVGQRDLIDAIECLIEHPNPYGVSMEICGRRCWDTTDIFDELGMLWRRFNHGRSAAIDIDDLQVKPPNVKVATAPISPPDFAVINSLLKHVNGVGWLPVTPMRVSLMELLSDYVRE